MNEISRAEDANKNRQFNDTLCSRQTYNNDCEFNLIM